MFLAFVASSIPCILATILHGVTVSWKKSKQDDGKMDGVYRSDEMELLTNIKPKTTNKKKETIQNIEAFPYDNLRGAYIQ